MTDTLSRRRRSWNMSRIRSANTSPERAVRSAIHRLGYRFRIHRRDLPGTPDIVLPRFRVAIFVHGCFWHRHSNCRFAYTPRSRQRFWKEKFAGNVVRDRRSSAALRSLGWKVFIIWECEARDTAGLQARLLQLLPARR